VGNLGTQGLRKKKSLGLDGFRSRVPVKEKRQTMISGQVTRTTFYMNKHRKGDVVNGELKGPE